MKGIAQGLVVLAVAGHVAFATVGAFAMSSGGLEPARAAAGAEAGRLQLAQSTNGGQQGAAPAPAPAPAPATGHGGGNPALIFAAPPSVPGGCGVELRLPDASAYPNALEGLAAVSAATQQHLERCGCATQACVADALDKYAVELKKIAPRLPRALRKLPQVVVVAAQKVRAAPSLPAAVRVARVAVATVQTVVRKAITLMRAADPDAVSSATRGGDLVANTLETAAKALERAETL